MATTRLKEMRFQKQDVCGACQACNGKICEPVRQPLRDYRGIRFTADGFDCALPVSIDSHSHCSYACQYCFSDNLLSHREGTSRGIGQQSLLALEKLFAGEPEYLEALSKAPNLFWVAFSIITADDEVIRRIDRRAPDASARLETMKKLNDIGVKTSLRFRPMIPGVSDRTRKMDKAYRVLIERAAQAGACAISYEVAFSPGAPDASVKKRWEALSQIAGYDLLALYKRFGRTQACTRPPAAWTEEIMHAVRDVAHECNMTVGVSDPVWKQLGDTGCCCGILPDDPVFGNWQRESATNQLLEAKATGKEIHFQDVVPEWAKSTLYADLCNTGVGPTAVWKTRHMTWEDRLRENWNTLDKERSTLNYFQGALVPVRRDENGDIVYQYVGLERQNQSYEHWRV